MRNRAHLGKGLQALIPSTIDDVAPSVETIQEIDAALIDPNPFQPRMIFDEESFEELKRSIEEKGVIQPIVVRSADNGRFQVVAGERRLRATLALGIRMIPAYIKEVETDEEMLEIALIENVQREHLNPIDLAKGYQRLIDECALTQEDVAKKIGKDRTTVANVIRLLKLPEKIQDSLSKGDIKEGHARALLGISDNEIQERIWRKAVNESLSVRSVEQLVRKSLGKAKEQSSKPMNRTRKPAVINKMEAKLREKFGTQVKIRTRKGGGSIEVIFYSTEDLERLMEIFDQIKY